MEDTEMTTRRSLCLLCLLAAPYFGVGLGHAAVGVMPRGYPPGFDSLGTSYDEVAVCFNARPRQSDLDAFGAANSLRLADRLGSWKVYLFKLDDSLKVHGMTARIWADSLCRIGVFT
jgi:hypothetical protein